ncbi:MAG: hypothetical protein Q9170_005039 [Blastenia crenularia]
MPCLREIPARNFLVYHSLVSHRCIPRATQKILRKHFLPHGPLSPLKSRLRFASTTAAVAASTSPAQDARSLFTRIKNLLLGSTIGLTLILGYFYITDTRASIHEFVVIPCLRYFYPDAEDAHEFGNRALKALGSFGLHPRERGNPDAKGDLAIEVFGHTLSNPLGISAGIDKHCDIPDVLFAAGPAVVEIGGVTPHPQEGNPKPRVWRVPSQNALVNRYGLNSEGADHVAMRLRQRVREYAYHMGWGIDEEAEQRVLDGEAEVPPGSLKQGNLLAVQVAKNSWTSEEDIDAVMKDYVYCVDTLSRYADIVIVNVSSPNTQGLRGLQKVEPLTDILTAVVEAARKAKRKTSPKVLVKVSPDEDSEDDVKGICEAVWESGVDGVVVGNTTKRRDPSREGFRLPAQEQRDLLEQGGYSGPQTFNRTLALVKRYRKILDEDSFLRTRDGAQQPSAQSSPSAGSSSDETPSIFSSISSPLETPKATHPPTTHEEIEESVARDKQHLKPQSPEAEADSKSQPLFRIPERNNPFSSSSTSEATRSSLTSSNKPPGLSATDATPSFSPNPTPGASSSPRSEPTRKVIFASGGVTTGGRALEALSAGADVAQVYTALVYEGIGKVSKIKEEMRMELKQRSKQ